MSWTCYSCGNVNSNALDTCQKCKGTVAAPRSFYIHWVFGGAVFFFIFYLAGTLAGGVLVEAKATPSNEQILELANQKKASGDAEITAVETIKFEDLAAIKAVASRSNKAAISPFLVYTLQWILPVIMFVLCGIIVGFVSDGKTIIEAGIGSVIGQAAAVALHVYVIETDLTWMTFAIGALPGFGLGFLGAWLGEVIQDRKERAGGITA